MLTSCSLHGCTVGVFKHQYASIIIVIIIFVSLETCSIAHLIALIWNSTCRITCQDRNTTLNSQFVNMVYRWQKILLNQDSTVLAYTTYLLRVEVTTSLPSLLLHLLVNFEEV